MRKHVFSDFEIAMGILLDVKKRKSRKKRHQLPAPAAATPSTASAAPLVPYSASG
jgi:hypothetical protein